MADTPPYKKQAGNLPGPRKGRVNGAGQFSGAELSR